MARRASDPWILADAARKLWQATFTGEYIGDGRDMREAKGFLETNPDFLQREDWREVIAARWKRYMLSTFWNKYDFPVYAFYMQFRKWAPPIEKRSTAKIPGRIQTMPCPDCMAEGVETIHKVTDYCPRCATKVAAEHSKGAANG